MKYKKICSLVLVIIIVMGIGSSSVSAEQCTDVVYYKKNSQKKIAITFDDGPHPTYTPEILDILNEYNIRATFFVVGQNVELYPDIVKRAISEGHDIGNHTFTHCHISETSFEAIIDEIQACEDKVYELCEYHVKLFRPPEGVLPDDVRNYAVNEDYSVILWSIDTYDWARAPISNIKRNITKNISSGDIILMHDYVPDSITPQALRIIIPMLLEQGYQFVTVSELIGCE